MVNAGLSVGDDVAAMLFIVEVRGVVDRVKKFRVMCNGGVQQGVA